MELMATGFEGRQNKLFIYCPPKPVQNVIFFQGDAQDLKEEMEAQHYEIKQYKPWCLEETCSLLQSKFPDSAIWIVRPKQMLRHLYACYHNFVESSITGVPTYDDTGKKGTVHHLEQLLLNAIHQISPSLELSEESVYKLPLIIIGFSKGGVVLNQILYELGNYIKPGSPSKEGCENKERLSVFLKQIKSIYWLDSGHSGEENAWIKDVSLLSHLACLNPEVHVHVTDYQMKCPQRPWIAEEERQFVEVLKEMGVKITETHHFHDKPRSLMYHFKILNVFQ